MTWWREGEKEQQHSKRARNSGGFSNKVINFTSFAEVSGSAEEQKIAGAVCRFVLKNLSGKYPNYTF